MKLKNTNVKYLSHSIFCFQAIVFFIDTSLNKASLLKSPGLVSVFWPSLAMLSFGQSPLVRQLPSPPSPLIILQLLCLTHQSQLAQSLLSCSTVFFNSLARSRCLSFFSLSFSCILQSAWTAKSTVLLILFFFEIR